MPICGVLFDLDGALVDSVQLHFLCWTYILDFNGLSIKKNNFYRLEEDNIYGLMSTLMNPKHDKLLRILIKKKDDIFSEIIKFNVFSGIQETLTFLKNSNQAAFNAKHFL